jgi:hypothetical protein
MQLSVDEHLRFRVVLDCDVLPTYFCPKSEIIECNNKFVHPLF